MFLNDVLYTTESRASLYQRERLFVGERIGKKKKIKSWKKIYIYEFFNIQLLKLCFVSCT